MIKAGEFAALIAPELAVKDLCGAQISNGERSFAKLLKHMVDGDSLTDAQIPMVTRCGGTAIGQLTGATRPTLGDRRNALAHGDPFEGLPTGGLLELVRDLSTSPIATTQLRRRDLDVELTAARKDGGAVGLFSFRPREAPAPPRPSRCQGFVSTGTV
ncbi:hypothetical protein NKH56_30170 [Mesorhizobium sp. M1076]|uniref:hypothetical protein n=1 Tax=Mesorhizobium sp. M1076 TaxID=2957054 RepID=UPI00333D55BC